MSNAASSPPPLPPPASSTTTTNNDVMAAVPPNPEPGFISLCRSLHGLLEAGRYSQVWSTTNDILARALKLIDPISADFIRDDDPGSASVFLLFHEYLLYAITAPGWALILALQRTKKVEVQPEVAAQIFHFFMGAQKIADSLCRVVLACAKGRTGLVERTWKVRSMLLEETRSAIESLYEVDTGMLGRAARSPFGKEAAIEPWQMLEALVPGGVGAGTKRSVGDLLRGWG